MLDRNVLADVAFVLLQLLLHCLTVLLRVHAELGRSNGVATMHRNRLQEVLGTVFGASVITGKKVARMVREQALAFNRSMLIDAICTRPLLWWQ